MPKKGETMTEEQKAKMRAGREKARLAKIEAEALAVQKIEELQAKAEEPEGPNEEPDEPEPTPIVSEQAQQQAAEILDLKAGQEELRSQLTSMTSLLEKLTEAALLSQGPVHTDVEAVGLGSGAGEDLNLREKIHARAHDTREGMTREAESRTAQLKYAPPEVLTTPPAPAGLTYRWVAEYVRGEYQDQNLDYRHAEGWRPVTRDELPQGFHARQAEDGLVRRGGLVLMKIHSELIRQRQVLIARRSREQLEGANELQGMGTKGRELPVIEEDHSRTLEGREAMNFLTEASGG